MVLQKALPSSTHPTCYSVPGQERRQHAVTNNHICGFKGNFFAFHLQIKGEILATCKLARIFFISSFVAKILPEEFVPPCNRQVYCQQPVIHAKYPIPCSALKWNTLKVKKENKTTTQEERRLKFKLILLLCKIVDKILLFITISS